MNFIKNYSYKIYYKIIVIFSSLIIPILTKYKMINTLSILFILNLKVINELKPKNKIKYKVLVLNKSVGIDDVLSIPKDKNKDTLYLDCQRSFFKKIYYTIYKKDETIKLKKNESKLLQKKYLEFLILFLENLIKKYKFNAFIGFNYNYFAEKDLHLACRKLGILFLLLYKEGVSTKIMRKYAKFVLKKNNFKFNGHKIAVYSKEQKKEFVESKFVLKENVIVTGCSRLCKSFSFRNKIPNNQITYYAVEKGRGFPTVYVDEFGNKFFKDFKTHKLYNQKLNWNNLHVKTVKILKKFALKNPHISIIIKIKTGSQKNIRQYLNLPKNIKVVWFGSGHQLIEKSKVIIGWNTTAVLEGIAANRFILLPYFHSKNKSYQKDFELNLKLKSENYGYSEDDFYKKLQSLINKKYYKNKTYNNKYSLRYYLGNDDNKANLRLYKFINSNLKKNQTNNLI